MRSFGLLLVSLLIQACTTSPTTINQLQFVGSHNSYKLAMDEATFAVLAKRNLEAANSLEYWHIPLEEQLDAGLRKLELDIFYADDGSFVVGHVQKIDMNSSCVLLVDCFTEVLSWSSRHPEHIPVWISFNTKDQTIEGLPIPRLFTAKALEDLDRAIIEEFEGRIIWPREVSEFSWPKIKDSRGKFLFVLDEQSNKRDIYIERWRERPMFVNVLPPHPAAALLIINDPVAKGEEITKWVAEGYMVRTRADADTKEARADLTKRRDMAIKSGAQAISTDYYLRASHFDSSYQVEPFIICNPINTSGRCRFKE